MKNGVIFLQQKIYWLGILAVTSVCAAHASPKITVRADPNLDTYQKVYLAQSKSDPEKIYPRVIKRLQKLGFEVVELKPEKLPFVSQGSGFLLSSEGHILTCAHVVGNEPQATLWIQGVRYMGRIAALDTNLDAAVIKIEAPHPPFRPLPFSTEQPLLGQDAFTMGFPLADVLGTKARLNKGLISSTSGLGDNPNELQISAEAQAGSSGCPLLNSKGHVIGMVSSKLNPLRVLLLSGDIPQNVNFAIKSEPLVKFLASAKISYCEGTNPPMADAFSEVEKSLALIRGGVVDEERFRERPLLCRCQYFVFNGDFWKLRIDFIDVRQLRVVLSATLDQKTVASQNSVLDQMFGAIAAKFFPDQASKNKK